MAFVAGSQLVLRCPASPDRHRRGASPRAKQRLLRRVAAVVALLLAFGQAYASDLPTAETSAVPARHALGTPESTPDITGLILPVLGVICLVASRRISSRVH